MSKDCADCSWKNKCEKDSECRAESVIEDLCKNCDFWYDEIKTCMFGELDCDDPNRRKCNVEKGD